jgi:hypothetical protein
MQVCIGRSTGKPAGGSMLTMHLPKKFEQVTRSFAGSDPTAWWLLLGAACSLAVIVALFFSR